jgi:hypothetical protein
LYVDDQKNPPEWAEWVNKDNASSATAVIKGSLKFIISWLRPCNVPVNQDAFLVELQATEDIYISCCTIDSSKQVSILSLYKDGALSRALSYLAAVSKMSMYCNGIYKEHRMSGPGMEGPKPSSCALELNPERKDVK